VLVGDRGVVGVVHAGWRGAAAGVLPAAVAAVRDLGGGAVGAVMGPCIHPCCYEFGAHDMRPFVDRHGTAVAGRTDAGTLSLDMPEVVRRELALLDVGVLAVGGCTACSGGRWFSHRRGDRGRQVMTVVLGATA
jgi:copper oxidase (laccase) domain-containing protein